jgi:hypothetical protein
MHSNEVNKTAKIAWQRINIIVTILHFREQCRNNLVTVSFITSGLNVNMLWCFSYGTDDGILNVGWLHWKQLLKIQVD